MPKRVEMKKILPAMTALIVATLASTSANAGVVQKSVDGTKKGAGYVVDGTKKGCSWTVNGVKKGWHGTVNGTKKGLKKMHI
jgi:hypothetical protein